MKVSWEYYSQYIWKNKKCSKPPTSLPSFTHVSWHRYNSPFTIHRRPTTPPRGPKRPLHDLRKEVHRTRGPGSGEGVHAAILEEIFDGQLLHWVSLAMINGNFRILKLELLYICTIFLAIFYGDVPLPIWPLTWGPIWAATKSCLETNWAKILELWQHRF